jgi:hypothetical protein
VETAAAAPVRTVCFMKSRRFIAVLFVGRTQAL